MISQVRYSALMTPRQALIAQYFNELGACYRHRARERPGEQDNPDNDGAYDDFAAFLMTLPANEFRLRRLWAFACQPGESTLSPGPNLSVAIARLRTGEFSSFDTFLNSLVQAAIDDTVADATNPACKVFIGQSNREIMEGPHGPV